MSNAAQHRQDLIDLIKDRWTVTEDDVTTSGGEHTKTYLDIPRVLGTNSALHLGSQVLAAHLDEHDLLGEGGALFTAIGGPMTGSIPLVTGVVRELPWHPSLKWFVLRDKPKTHGLGRWEVGAELTGDDKVILVDDVASTGKSLVIACGRIVDAGAQVLAVVPLVDRGTRAAGWFDPDAGWPTSGIPYLPVLTYKDLDLPPLGAS